MGTQTHGWHMGQHSQGGHFPFVLHMCMKERSQLGGVSWVVGMGVVGAKRVDFDERSMNTRFIIDVNS